MILTVSQIRKLAEMVVPFDGRKEVIIENPEFYLRTIIFKVPVYGVGSNTSDYVILDNGGHEPLAS